MRGMVGLILCLATASCGLAGPNYPFTVDDSARVVYVLDEVVVYYPKPAQNPYSILEIPRERIELQSANSLAEVIKYDPGLLVTTGTKNSSELRIRGSAAESVLLLLDGRPLNAGYFGSSDLSLLPVDQIEKIQVIKGPSSVVYGANGMGGIINIITKGGNGLPLRASFRSLFGDLNHREISGSLGGSLGEYSGWLTVEETHQDAVQLSDDFPATSIENGGSRDNSDLNRVGIHLKVDRQLGDRGVVAWSMGYIQADKGLPSSTHEARYWRFVDWMRSGGNLSGLYHLRSEFTVKGSLFANRYDDELVDYLDNTYSLDRINYDSQMKNWTYGGSIENQWKGIRNHQMTFGAKGQVDRSRRRDVDTDEPWSEYSTRTGSLFMEDRWSQLFGIQDLLLTSGIGLYGFTKVQVEKSNSEWCPMLSLTYQFPYAITTHLGMSRNILFPTIHQLYSRSSGYEYLKPEETWKYGFSVECRGLTNQTFKLNPQFEIFYNTINNQIDKSPATNIFRNLYHLETWGTETGVDWGYHRWLSGSLSWAFLNWKSEENIILETPHYKGGGNITAVTPFQTRINVEVTWFSKRKAESLSGATVYLPDYTVCNATLTQPMGGVAPAVSWLEIRFEARNLFDTNYEEEYGYPGPGRMVLGGINVNIGKREK